MKDPSELQGHCQQLRLHNSVDSGGGLRGSPSAEHLETLTIGKMLWHVSKIPWNGSFLWPYDLLPLHVLVYSPARSERND
jgi:hypothetical protein